MIRWGVLGVGTAGKARVRAMRADPRAMPVLGFRGDPASVGLTAAPSVAALIAAVDAVAVCSPDETHPALVEAALRAGRHVVCEFPLAQTAAEAHRLLALAQRNARVLHVEHIELLGSAARWWRGLGLSAVTHGTLSFTTSRTGVPLALANVARLHRLMDAVGPPDDVMVEHRASDALRGVLWVGDAPIQFCFRAAAGLPRETRMAISSNGYRFEQVNRSVWRDGHPVDLPASGGLFLADQHCVSARILDGALGYVSEHRIRAVLSLAEQLATAPLGQRCPVQPVR